MLRVTVNPSDNPKLVGDKRDPRYKDTYKRFYATYRAVGHSCPASCPLLNAGCYAQSGKVAFHQRGRVSDRDGDVFRDAVLALPHGSIVRLHVSGDVMRDEGPGGSTTIDHEYLQAIVDTAAARPDIRMYGYTHAWRLIDRKRYAWPSNLVLNASVDDPADVPVARALGWNTTTVVPSDTAWRRDGNTVVCPAQTTEGMSCATCMLCAKGDRSLTVAFRAHGTGKRKVDERVALPVA